MLDDKAVRILRTDIVLGFRSIALDKNIGGNICLVSVCALFDMDGSGNLSIDSGKRNAKTKTKMKIDLQTAGKGEIVLIGRA